MDPGESLKLCYKCGRLHPASDHMKPGSTTVFKWCGGCRQRGRARGQLRRQRKKAVIASFEAQSQANPQLTQSIYNDVAARSRSAFSFREELPFLTTPPLTLTSQRSETPGSASVESAEIEIPMSQRGRSWSPETVDCSESSSQSDSEEDTESSITTSTTAYFVCTHCSIPRRAGLEYSGICVYCLEPQQKYCIPGDHEADRSEFYDSEGKEQASCRNCREGIPFDEEMEIAQRSDDDEDDNYGY